MKRQYWKYITTIFPYLKRHKLLASGSLITMTLGALISLAEPWPIAFLVDTLGNVRSPNFIRRFVGES
jgi:hypothetical protein